MTRMNIYPAGKRYCKIPQALNILILGDGWALKDRKFFEGACENLAKWILNIEPYKCFKNYINIFGAYKPSSRPYESDYYGEKDYGVPYGKPNNIDQRTAFSIYYNDSIPGQYNGSLRCSNPKRIYDFVETLNRNIDSENLITNWINGGDLWLKELIPDHENGEPMPNKSFGLIGIIVPNKRRGGVAYSEHTQTTIEVDGQLTRIRFFLLGTYNLPEMVFVHELGHNLGLDDEYENRETKNSPPWDFETLDTLQEMDPPQYPMPLGNNIIKKEDIVSPGRDLTNGLTVLEIIRLKWGKLLSEDDIEVLKSPNCFIPHISRKDTFTINEWNNVISFSETNMCSPDSILNAQIEDGEYNIQGFCEAIKNAMDNASVNGYEYTVQSDELGRIKISSNGQYFSLLLYSGDYGPAALTGFERDDYMGATEYTAQHSYHTPKADRNPYPETDYLGVIRLVEGGNYVRRDVFRSNYNCIMRFHYVRGVQYCKVCHHHIIKKITGNASSDYILGDYIFKFFPK